LDIASYGTYLNTDPVIQARSAELVLAAAIWGRSRETVSDEICG
jgi:hypothetical protein